MAGNWEQITHQGQPARLYPDGSIRNERGHPLPGTKIPNDGHEITHDNAREMLLRRHELKRAVIQEAANSAVQRADFKVQHGDLAFVAEIAYNAQIKATTPD